MNQGRLLSTIGLVNISLLLLSSCFPLKPIAKHQKSTNLDRISQTSKTISSGVVANFKREPLAKVTANSLVFDDLPQDLDDAQSDLLTDTAKLLAGMNIRDRSELALLKDTRVWSNHHRFLTTAWSQLEIEQLVPIRQWTQQELSDIDTSNSSIFYPFSDANFLQVYSLFSQGQEFILIGLEPVGTVPNLAYLPIEKLEQELQKVRTYLDNIFPSDYFSDRHSSDFQTIQALPALYVFLAKTNNRILDVEYIGISSEGKIQKFQKGMVSGVKITFVTQGDSQPRFVYYFSADLSNEGMETNPELVKFINNRTNLITYLEKASYLMYFDSFSQIKDLILAGSSYLLQDDSGMPVNAFDSKQWNLKFYGNYTQPVALFKNKYQPELWKIYHYKNNIKPLKFSIGYQSEIGKSNLMLAENKSK